MTIFRTSDSRRNQRGPRPIVVRQFLWLLVLVSPLTHAANQAPVANAGIEQSIQPSMAVQLNGLESSDSDGIIKSWRWTQLSGQKVKLSNAKIAAPSFTTPPALPVKVSARTLIFKLTVVDNKNKKATDTVTINLVACTPPQILRNNICQLPSTVCRAPNKLQNGLCLPPPPLTCRPPLAPIDGACRFPPVVCTLPQTAQNEVCALPVASTQFNDTGVTLCSDTDTNGDFCPISSYPGQDGDFGRDFLLNDDTDGRAGFSFTKLDANGSPLPASETVWSCIQDNVSGLIWENKTLDGGLHDKNKLFSQYSAEFNPIGNLASENDAAGFVAAVNTLGLCGANDWRLPDSTELQGIVDYSIGYPGPAIEGSFFAATVNSKFWSSSANAADPTQAWVVSFDDGRVFADQRAQGIRIRLVRNGRVNDRQ